MDTLLFSRAKAGVGAFIKESIGVATMIGITRLAILITRYYWTPYKGINRIDYAGNFEVFLDARPEGQPICFWLGTKERYRGYE